MAQIPWFVWSSVLDLVVRGIIQSLQAAKAPAKHRELLDQEPTRINDLEWRINQLETDRPSSPAGTVASHRHGTTPAQAPWCVGV